MYEVKILTEFSAAHQLRGFQGSCEKLHGHNWKIEICVMGEQLDKTGLLIDFRVLKNHTKAILSNMDHSFLNDFGPFRDLNPSSELIARYIFDELSKLINSSSISVSRVSAWESDSSRASYFKP